MQNIDNFIIMEFPNCWYLMLIIQIWWYGYTRTKSRNWNSKVAFSLRLDGLVLRLVRAIIFSSNIHFIYYIWNLKIVNQVFQNFCINKVNLKLWICANRNSSTKSMLCALVYIFNRSWQSPMLRFIYINVKVRTNQ